MPNWLSVIAWVIAAFVTLRTLKFLKEQAQAATGNVLATHALANLERPWVVIYPRKPSYWPHPEVFKRSSHWPFTETPSEYPVTVEVAWDQFNFGRSPALVAKFSASLRLWDMPVTDDLKPDYKPPDDVAPLFLAPNGEKPHDSRLFKTLSRQEFLAIRAIRAGEKAIVLYGSLEYEDTIENDSHKTRFCMLWYYKDGRPFYSPAGPKNYIEFT